MIIKTIENNIEKLNEFNEEVFNIHVRETNTSIYCTRLEVIKVED